MNLQAMQEAFIKQLSEFQINASFLKQIKPRSKVLPEQQVAIYQNNVRGALQSCLAQVYPVCHTILGATYFKQLAKSYIQTHPSLHPDLNCYGEAFSVFMQQQCQQFSELAEFPYLSDLVTLEWSYHQVYYASSTPAFDFDAFAKLSDDQQAQKTFRLVPCLQFVESIYPILSIWKLNQKELPFAKHQLSQQAENVVVFRKESRIELFEIELEVVSLLSLIQSGASLEKIVQAELDAYLPPVIQQGWIN